jgi:hypothetical protein
VSPEEIARLILEGKPVPKKDDKKKKDDGDDKDVEASAVELVKKIKKDLGVSDKDIDGDDKENDPVGTSTDDDKDGKPDATEKGTDHPDSNDATEPHGKPDGQDHVGSDDEVNAISDDDVGKPEPSEPKKPEPKKPDMSKQADKSSENPVEKHKKKAEAEDSKDGDAPADDGDDSKKADDEEKDPDSKENKAFSDDKDVDGDDQNPEKGEDEPGDDEDGEDPSDKDDESTEEDGEGGTVKGDAEDGQEDIELIDGSSKSKININPEIPDENATQDEPAEAKDDEDQKKADKTDPESKVDPDKGDDEDKPEDEDDPEKGASKKGGQDNEAGEDTSDDKGPDKKDAKAKDKSDEKKPDPKAKKKKVPLKEFYDDPEFLALESNRGAEVVSPKFGIGRSIPGQFYLHYDGDWRVDVMFDHGIEKNHVVEMTGKGKLLDLKQHYAKSYETLKRSASSVNDRVSAKANHQRADQLLQKRVKKLVHEDAKRELSFNSVGHHSRMYRHHDQQARILQRRLDKKPDDSKLKERLDYHKDRCSHHEAQLDTRK